MEKLQVWVKLDSKINKNNNAEEKNESRDIGRRERNKKNQIKKIKK